VPWGPADAGRRPLNVYITTNEFSLLGPEFNGAQVYAIAKSQLVAAGPTATPTHFVRFDKLSIGGAVATSIQPALTTGNPPAEFFPSSLDPSGTFDQRIGLWAVTNRGVVATGGKPTLSSLVTGSEACGVPPGAEQKGAESGRCCAAPAVPSERPATAASVTPVSSVTRTPSS
jgi:hypothetical protein